MQVLTNALETWASFYANHAAIRTAISFMHVGGLLGGGGCAVAADRTTLMSVKREASVRAMQIESLENSHRIVILGLVLVTISGFLLFAADTDTFIHSMMFWTKMALFVLLLVNGALLSHAGRRAAEGDERAWKRLVVTSIVSLGLWFFTTLAGTALPNIG